MALMILLRILLIGVCVIAVYAISKIFNMILGGEIIIEEEVIVVESDDEDEGSHAETKKSK